MAHNHDNQAFFSRERSRLAKEITSGFEELLYSSNVTNRKLEEVLGMAKEYDTIAALWRRFYQLMGRPDPDETQTTEQNLHGLPGTGGRLVSARVDITEARYGLKAEKVAKT